MSFLLAMLLRERNIILTAQLPLDLGYQVAGNATRALRTGTTLLQIALPLQLQDFR
jgi:hypothetical protein